MLFRIVAKIIFFILKDIKKYMKLYNIMLLTIVFCDHTKNLKIYFSYYFE